MRKLLLLLTPMMLLCASEKAPARKASKPKPAAAAATTRNSTPASSATVIPAGAVEVEPHLFRYTGPDGKVWLYRQTPFGISKSSEQAQQEIQDRQSRASGLLSKVRVTDNGDTVKFERATPMGNHSWVKKKSELTAEEKSWIASDSQTASTPGK